MTEFIIKDEDLVSLNSKVVIVTGMVILIFSSFGGVFMHIFDRD